MTATYVIGDVQGCFDQLQSLLSTIHFHPEQDRLWFTGDLVNRGPRSLEVLRFLKVLPQPPVIVLGNHDLHLLAVAMGVGTSHSSDTLNELLSAPDCKSLCEWLRHQPLLHHDETLGFTMVHAGFPPQWDLQTAQQCAHEVEKALRGETCVEFFQHMYGNTPDQWNEHLKEWDRLRFITNCFTRLRFCDSEGKLHLAFKGRPGEQSEGLQPWFKVPDRASKNLKIIFGHWAALMGRTDEPNVYPLDTGCVWGNRLTALRLEDMRLFSVPCERDPMEKK